jgi:hypothetical protein
MMPDSLLSLPPEDELLSVVPPLLSLLLLSAVPVLVPPLLPVSPEPLESGAIVSSLELSSVVLTSVVLDVDEELPLDDSLPSPATASSPLQPNEAPIPSAITQAFAVRSKQCMARSICRRAFGVFAKGARIPRS